MCKDFAAGIDNYTQTLTARKSSRVLLTVPHDGVCGLELEPFVPCRTGGNINHDMGVWPIVRDILGAHPANVVRGLLSRRYVDYNRAPEDAYETPQMAAPYDRYHGSIYVQLRQMLQCFAASDLLLIDAHGFRNQPSYAPNEGFDLILGTGNRTTIHHDEPDRALAAFLMMRGYKVFLPETNTCRGRYDNLNGGFTVRTVARELRINSVQIEIARRFRVRDAAVVGTRLSADIAAFLSEYYGR